MDRSKIDKNVPIPHTTRGRGSRGIYRDMKVGDSVWIAGNQKAGISSAWGRATGWKFTQRAEGDGLRVWRIK